MKNFFLNSVLMVVLVCSAWSAGISTSRSNLRTKSKSAVAQDSGQEQGDPSSTNRVLPTVNKKTGASAAREGCTIPDNCPPHSLIMDDCSCVPPGKDAASGTNGTENSRLLPTVNKKTGASAAREGCTIPDNCPPHSLIMDDCTCVPPEKNAGSGTNGTENSRLLPTVNKKTDAAGDKRKADSLATPE